MADSVIGVSWPVESVSIVWLESPKGIDGIICESDDLLLNYGLMSQLFKITSSLLCRQRTLSNQLFDC